MKQRRLSLAALVFNSIGFLYYSYIAFFSIFYRDAVLTPDGYYLFTRTQLSIDCIPVIAVFLLLVISSFILISAARKRKMRFIISAPILLIFLMAGMFFADTGFSEYIFFHDHLEKFTSCAFPYAVFKFIPFIVALIFEISALINKRRFPVCASFDAAVESV